MVLDLWRALTTSWVLGGIERCPGVLPVPISMEPGLVNCNGRQEEGPLHLLPQEGTGRVNWEEMALFFHTTHFNS